MATAQVLQASSTAVPIYQTSGRDTFSGVRKITSTLANWLHMHSHGTHHHHDHHASSKAHNDNSLSGTTSNMSTIQEMMDLGVTPLNHTNHICARCRRNFTIHTHRPSGLFYRDKCNYYHPGQLVTTREILARYEGNKPRQQSLIKRLGLTYSEEGFIYEGHLDMKVWSCCLRKDDGHVHDFGGCSFNGNKHVVDF